MAITEFQGRRLLDHVKGCSGNYFSRREIDEQLHHLGFVNSMGFFGRGERNQVLNEFISTGCYVYPTEIERHPGVTVRIKEHIERDPKLGVTRVYSWEIQI